MAYLIRNPLDGLRLPLDKRPRQPKSTITPEQFHALLALVPEPYASMLFVSVDRVARLRVNRAEVALHPCRQHHGRGTILPW